MTNPIFDDFHKDWLNYATPRDAAIAWLNYNVLLGVYSNREDISDAQRLQAKRVLRWIAGYEEV